MVADTYAVPSWLQTKTQIHTAHISSGGGSGVLPKVHQDSLDCDGSVAASVGVVDYGVERLIDPLPEEHSWSGSADTEPRRFPEPVKETVENGRVPFWSLDRPTHTLQHSCC